MPQCSQETQNIIDRYFPRETLGEFEGQDNIALAFLESRGYQLEEDWTWTKPVSAHTVSQEEWNCVIYLCTEWDFGGINAS